MTTERFYRGVGKHPSIITIMDGMEEIHGFGPGIDGMSPVGLVDRVVKKLNNSPLAVAAVENDEYGLYRLVIKYATMEARGE
jgi:hypothetical protein